MAYLSGYTKRWKVTVDNTKVPSTLTNFPVYVDLANMPASFWSTVANGGGDIRVTRSDGTTECAREVVSCDTATDTGELHFLANSVSGSADTDFYIYANGTSADYAVTDTYGRNNVWGDYSLVYHMAETSGNIIDSTGNLLNGTANGNPVYQQTGQVGSAIDFDGTGDYFNTADNTLLDFDGAFTIQYWVNYASGGGATRWPLFKGAGSAIGDASWSLYKPTNNANRLLLRNGSGTQNLITGSTLMTLNGTTWYKVTATRNSSWELDLYVNGASDAVTVAGTTSYTLNNANDMTVGSRNAGNEAVDGLIDEVRVRKGTAISADWETTEYNNQNSPSTFYTVGAMEEDGGGGAVPRNALFFGGGI